MQVLRFTLKGKNAFFKMPEVNSYCYFTYGNIHKVSLLGMFGAILGYKGYAAMKEQDEFPQFYERLHGIQVAIVPDRKQKGYIPRKVQSFNHTTGAASLEQGGVLIVKQQWLENPSWDIYVKIDQKEAEQIADFILNKRAIYIPYLGTNAHPATIENAELLNIEIVKEKSITIDSLFAEEDLEICYDYDEEEIIPYKYSEFLPVALKQKTNQYAMKKMIYTNMPGQKKEKDIYIAGDKKIIFI